jgi:hypothetical protein
MRPRERRADLDVAWSRAFCSTAFHVENNDYAAARCSRVELVVSQRANLTARVDADKCASTGAWRRAPPHRREGVPSLLRSSVACSALLPHPWGALAQRTSDRHLKLPP